MRRKIISGGSLITVLGATTVLLATVQANAGDDKALCDCAEVEDTCRAIVNLQQKELIIISDTYRCAQVTWRAEDGVVAALIKGGHREMEWSGESSNPFLMVTKCSICSGRSENNGGRAIMMSGAELTNVSRSCKAASGYRSKSDKVFTDDEAGKVIAHLSAMGRERAASLAYEAYVHQTNYVASAEEIEHTSQPHRRRSLEENVIFNEMAAEESDVKAKYMRCMLYQLGL